MSERNIVCIESSLPIEEVIHHFIQEERRGDIVQFFENQKEDTSEDSILLYDNFANQELPKELQDCQTILVVRLSDFNYWKAISSLEVVEKINSLFKRGKVYLYSNLN